MQSCLVALEASANKAESIALCFSRHVATIPKLAHHLTAKKVAVVHPVQAKAATPVKPTKSAESLIAEVEGFVEKLEAEQATLITEMEGFNDNAIEKKIEALKREKSSLAAAQAASSSGSGQMRCTGVATANKKRERLQELRRETAVLRDQIGKRAADIRQQEDAVQRATKRLKTAKADAEAWAVAREATAKEQERQAAQAAAESAAALQAAAKAADRQLTEEEAKAARESMASGFSNAIRMVTQNKSAANIFSRLTQGFGSVSISALSQEAADSREAIQELQRLRVVTVRGDVVSLNES